MFPEFRSRLVIIGLSLAAGSVAAVALAATSGSIGLRLGGQREAIGAAPEAGALASPGSPDIRWIDHQLVSPVATDGRLAYFAVIDAGAWQAIQLDPDSGAENVLGPVGDIDGILAVTRTPSGTVFAGSTRVALVRDDGSREVITLPPPERGAGLEGPPYVEALTARGDRVFVARFNDRDVLELSAAAGLAVVAVHQMPEGVSPPKQLRLVDDQRLLVATAYRSKGFDPGAWVIDLTARSAQRVDGAGQPDVVSPSGPMILLDHGRIVRLDDEVRAVSVVADRGPGLASVAATDAGETWYHNHHGPGEIVWSDAAARRVHVFALPTFYVYTAGEPAPESGDPTEIAPVVGAAGVKSMVALANGDLVFATSGGQERVGIIRSPRR